jgi:putative nucleotidyltransferase with HDIG domain
MVIERIFLPADLANELESYAVGFLSKGREWDVPHTKAVVYYAEQIAGSENLDLLVIVTAAWLHDIGYSSLFEGSDSKKFEQVMNKKAAHMVNGEKMAREFLAQPHIKSFYKKEQIERIVHLVSVHDKIDELKDKDEIALMEADTLGALDASRVTPTFNRKDAAKYINEDVLGRRFPKFQTQLGIRLFQEVLPRFMSYFEKN